MSKISSYEADAKQELYDTAQKIAAMHDQFVDDDQLMDDAAFRKIAPSLNHLDRLLTTYNGLCGACSDPTASHHPLSYVDLFGYDLAEEFVSHHEDRGVIMDDENTESILHGSGCCPIQSDSGDKYRDALEDDLNEPPTKAAWEVYCDIFNYIKKACFPEDTYPWLK